MRRKKTAPFIEFQSKLAGFSASHQLSDIVALLRWQGDSLVPWCLANDLIREQWGGGGGRGFPLSGRGVLMLSLWCTRLSPFQVPFVAVRQLTTLTCTPLIFRLLFLPKPTSFQRSQEERKPPSPGQQMHLTAVNYYCWVH